MHSLIKKRYLNTKSWLNMALKLLTAIKSSNVWLNAFGNVDLLFRFWRKQFNFIIHLKQKSTLKWHQPLNKPR
jgi:hypothetical protein